MEKEKTRRTRSRASSRAATHPGLESAAAFHRDEVERQRQHSRSVQPRSRAGKQLSAWLPANTLALCGAEVPLFLALDKLDDLAQRVRSEGQEAQTRFLRRLEASLQTLEYASAHAADGAGPNGALGPPPGAVPRAEAPQPGGGAPTAAPAPPGGPPLRGGPLAAVCAAPHGAGGTAALSESAVVVVCKSMAAHRASLPVQLWGTAALGHLAPFRSPGEAKVAAEEVLAAVVSGLRSHPLYSQLAAHAGAALSRLPVTKDSAPAALAGVEACVLALQAHGATDGEAAEQLCAAVANLAHGADCGPGAVAAGAPGGVIAAARAHPGLAGVQAQACRVLAACGGEPDGCAACLQAGAPTALVAAMWAHPRDEDVQECAAAAAAALAGGSPAGARALAQAGALPVLVAALQRHGPAHVHVAREATEALANLGVDGAATEEVVHASGLEAIVAVMAAHPTVEALQARGCWALGILAGNSEEHASRGIQAGALGACVSALGGHPQSPGVQQHGCWALGTLASTATCSADWASAVPAVVASMRGAPSQAGIQQLACYALTALVCANDDQPGQPSGAAAHVQAAAAGGIAACVACLRRHVAAPGVAQQAAAALGAIAGSAPNSASNVVAAQGVEALVAALRAHPGHAGAQREAALALAMVCEQTPSTGVAAAATSGAVKPLLVALHAAASPGAGQGDATAGSLAAACLAALGALGVDPSVAEQVTAAGGGPIILGAMRLFKDNPDVQAEGRAALKHWGSSAAAPVAPVRKGPRSVVGVSDAASTAPSTPRSGVPASEAGTELSVGKDVGVGGGPEPQAGCCCWARRR